MIIINYIDYLILIMNIRIIINMIRTHYMVFIVLYGIMYGVHSVLRMD